MLISCPDCNSNYNIEESLIPNNGRKIKCFNCDTFWIQFLDGKVKRLKLVGDFSNELKQKQVLVRNVLNTSNIKSETELNKQFFKSKEQEKEFLSSLAIDEIEKNKKYYSKPSNQSSNSNERVEQIRGKLNSNHEDSSSNYEKKQISKSFLGFFIISIFFIAFFLFYQNSDSILNLNHSFSDQLSLIINTTDLLINNLNHFITIMIEKIKNFF